MIARIILALLIAPPIPAFAFALFTPVSGGSMNTDVRSVIGLTVLFYCWSFAAAVLFGIPLFFVLLKLRLVRWWTALLSGALVGALVSVVIRLPGPPHPKDLLIDLPLGALSALIFWLIWRPRLTPNTSFERTRDG